MSGLSIFFMHFMGDTFGVREMTCEFEELCFSAEVEAYPLRFSNAVTELLLRHPAGNFMHSLVGYDWTWQLPVKPVDSSSVQIKYYKHLWNKCLWKWWYNTEYKPNKTTRLSHALIVANKYDCSEIPAAMTTSLLLHLKSIHEERGLTKSWVLTGWMNANGSSLCQKLHVLL